MTNAMRTWLIRVAVGLGIFIVGALAGWLIHGYFAQGDDVATIGLYQDWRLACPPGSERKISCDINQDIVDSKTHSQIAQLLMGNRNDKTILAITVPFNVLLDAGIGLQFGKDAVRVYPYETCNSVGCLAVVNVDDKLTAGLTGSKPARILLAGPDGKAVGLPFSLKGFPQAMNAYTSAEKRRHSWWRRLWS